MSTPQLINIHRARQLACDNYLKAGFEKFAQQAFALQGQGGLPVSFNSPEDTVEYLASTAKPIKVLLLSDDPTEGEAGGICGAPAYLLKFTEADDGSGMTGAVLAFFTGYDGVFLVWPESQYEILPMELTDEASDEEPIKRHLCAVGQKDTIVAALQAGGILQSAPPTLTLVK